MKFPKRPGLIGFQPELPVDWHATGFVTVDAETLLLQHLIDFLISFIKVSGQRCIFCRVGAGSAHSVDGWQLFGRTIGMNSDVSVARHTVTRVVIQTCAVRHGHIFEPDDPAFFHDFANPVAFFGFSR